MSEKVLIQTVEIGNQKEITIGRRTNNTICLSKDMVSKYHAVILEEEEQWYIVDDKSTNGTYINGKRIKKEALTEQIEIQISAYILKWTKERVYVYDTEATIMPNEKTVQKWKDTATKPSPRSYPILRRAPLLLIQRPTKSIEIEAAPSIGSKPEMDWVAMLLPTGISLIVSLVTAVATAGAGILLSAAMTIFGIIMSVRNYKKQKKGYENLEKTRETKYMAYLEEKERALQEVARIQRESVESINKSPQECVKLVEDMSSQLWAKTYYDEAFLTLRMGLGEEPLCVEVQTPKIGLTLEEDEYLKKPQQLAQKYQKVTGVPVLCNVFENTALGIVGNREQALGAMRNLIVQATTYHGYDQMKLVVVYPSKEKEVWEWTRWLPHVFSESRDCRYIITDGVKNDVILKRLEEEFKERLSNDEMEYGDRGNVPHYLFVIADTKLLPTTFLNKYVFTKQAREIGVSYIQLEKTVSYLTAGINPILSVQEGKGEFYYKTNAGQKTELKIDTISVEDADRLARAMAPIRLPLVCDTSNMPSYVTFLDGFNRRRVEELEIAEYWNNATTQGSMAVPIGIRANGEKFYFDIHPKAHGPHGLIGGMTGSGKTEMIQTWILSMALQYSPQEVSFVLIDFKGTGLLEPFAGKLPHVASTLSNLDRNISKNLIALRSELTRRQQLFSAAGVVKISEYQKLYRAGKVSEPMAYLFIVIDEYKEFKKQFPEFTAQIDTLFATGRSLGVFIVVMAQNPEGAITSDSESNVHFRWCLKVANTAASKSVLGGHPDAAYINTPGRAYVRVGEDEVYELVQSFFAGAPYEPEKAEKNEKHAEVYPVRINGIREKAPKAREVGIKKSQKQIDAVVEHIRQYAKNNHIPKARSIWSGSLDKILYLPNVLDQVETMVPGELMPAVGVLDNPSLQQQYPMQVPLSKDGHVVLYGASGSGKSTWLQTLIVSLSTQYSPEEVNIYILDFDKWTMGMFKDYPQVGGIAYSNNEIHIEKTIQLLNDQLTERKRLFAEAGAGTLKSYCHITNEKLPHIVLMVDKYDMVNDINPRLGEFLYEVAKSGKAYGIYLVMTVNDKNAVNYKFKTHVKTYYVLQMNDVQDYKEVMGHKNGLVPEHTVGRGLCKEGTSALEFQTALPTDDMDELDRMDQIIEISKKLRDYYEGLEAPRIPVMPEVVSYTNYEDAMVLGLESRRVRPVAMDWESCHYLLVSGEKKSGKTTLLRMMAQQALDSGARAVIYGNPKEYEDCVGAQILQGSEEVDFFIESLATELQRRSECKKAGEAEFTDIYIMIDGYKKLFDAFEQITHNRLIALESIGAGLGVYLLISDDTEQLAKCSMDAVISNALLRHVIVSGGSMLQHTEISVSMDILEKQAILEKYEAYYIRNGMIERLKIMNAKENE